MCVKPYEAKPGSAEIRGGYFCVSVSVFVSVHVCVQSKEGMPMRFPTGVNRDRFNLITAVLAKHARLKVRASLKQSTCLC